MATSGPHKQAGRLTASVLETTRVNDRGAGLVLLRDGAVGGVLSSSRTGLRLDVAGAAGPTTAADVERVISRAASDLHLPLTVRDVVPLSMSDQRGLAMFFTGLGIALGSSALVQGLNRMRIPLTWSQRVFITGVFSVLTGVAGALLTGPVTGALPGPPVPVATTLALLSAAGALTTQALTQWVGAAGLPAATVLFVGVGMPTSGGVVDTDLLPPAARSMSALLPPGAAARAIRNFCYFDGVHVVGPLLTLTGWATAAAALLWARTATSRGPTPVPVHAGSDRNAGNGRSRTGPVVSRRGE
ncbi:hypothetical protein AB0F77_22440 [Streptomyces sp. NPDC026672]|uniref:hypothetical protein n=1 Tax=unclassified Streptomyces TaxID=2593676 RepID=UPI0033C999DC